MPSLAGGFASGRYWAAGAAVLLLSLGFLGLAHALIELTGGAARRRNPQRLRGLVALTSVAVVLLLALVGAGIWLPGSDIVDALVRGLS